MNNLDMSEGIFKRIYIDPARLRAGEHAWTIQTDKGRVVAAALQAGIWEGVYSRQPLFFDGPNCWLESVEEWEMPDSAEVVVWPVPIRGSGSVDLDVGGGVLKRVHVDRHRLRKNEAAWTVRTDRGLVRSDGLALGEGLVGVQSRQPLFHRGPKAWVEATCEVTVAAADRIHQAIFPKRLSPTEVPHGAPRR